MRSRLARVLWTSTMITICRQVDAIYSLTKLVIPMKRCLAISFILYAACVTVQAKQSGYAQVNGTKIYYQTAGSGPWVVLIHGGLVDRRLWDDQFRQFAKHFSVLRYDLRGYGRSQFPDKEFSHIDDLYALLRSLRIKTASLVGLSVGGNIAMEFALAHPDMTEKLVLVASSLLGSKVPRSAANTAVYETAEKKGMMPAVEMWLENPLFATGRWDPKYVKRIRRMLIDNYKYWGPTPEPIPEVWPTPPTAEKISTIKAPTLIIVGDQDAENIRQIADILSRDIAGSKKVIMNNVSHHLNMEKPTEFNGIVINFLRR